MVQSARALHDVARRAARIAALAAGLPAVGWTQQVRGTVVDEATGLPIIAVEVVAFEVKRAVASDTARTDSAGFFLVTLPRTGKYVIRARRIGYEAVVTGTFDVRRREDDLVVRVAMDPAATTLARIIIIEKRHIPVSSLLDGFERRRRMGLGTFFSREDIEERHPATVMDLLSNIPGLRVSRRGTTDQMSSTRGVLNIQGRSQCMPIFWVDGVRMNFAGSGQHVLQWLPRGHELQAVEVYQGRASYPAEFGGPEARCGVIVLWTRPPLRERPDSSGVRAATRDTIRG